MHLQDDDDGIVCRVLPSGEVVCEKVPDTMVEAPVAMFISGESSAKSFGPPSADEPIPANWGPHKKKLASMIMQVLNESELPDDIIPRRGGEIVDSVKQLLAPLPPSILLYNYSTQPANVMGAYYLNKADLVQMQRMYEIFKNPKKPS